MIALRGFLNQVLDRYIKIFDWYERLIGAFTLSSWGNTPSPSPSPSRQFSHGQTINTEEDC